MPASEIPEKFLVAFSFAGEQRDLVQSIATAVQERLGEGTVFFDEWYEYYIAGSDADLKLQKIYHERSVLVISCVRPNTVANRGPSPSMRRSVP